MATIKVTLTRADARQAHDSLKAGLAEWTHDAKLYPSVRARIAAVSPVYQAIAAALAGNAPEASFEASYHDIGFALVALSEAASSASSDGEYGTSSSLDRVSAAIETAKTEALRPKVAVSGHREMALELHRRLGTDAMLRQGDPVETLAHALALAADAASDGAMRTLSRLRASGWTVAVHNDYRLSGAFNTFWLLTRKDGMSAKGEGPSDDAALEQAAARIAEIEAADDAGQILWEEVSKASYSQGLAQRSATSEVSDSGYLEGEPFALPARRCRATGIEGAPTFTAHLTRYGTHFRALAPLTVGEFRAVRSGVTPLCISGGGEL